MRKIQNKKSGFTLIELMIVVAILGILAAVAIPAFATYIRRSKTSEVAGNIEGMFKAISAYYNKEHTPGTAGTINTTALTNCTVAETSTIVAPTDTKQMQLTATVATGAPFAENGGIGFAVGPSYYRYTNVGTEQDGLCGHGTGEAATLTAIGNLDLDAVSSTFTLSILTNPGNEFYKAGQLFVSNELE